MSNVVANHNKLCRKISFHSHYCKRALFYIHDLFIYWKKVFIIYSGNCFIWLHLPYSIKIALSGALTLIILIEY